jgi:hypothetical protein
VVQLRWPDGSARATFDEASGRLLELSMPGTNLQGAPVEESRRFEDFDGKGFPTKVLIFHDGALAAETRIESITLEPDIPEGLFDQPEEQKE